VIAVDTNIIVRFLTADEPKQYAAVLKLFRRNKIWISHSVLLETAWVLQGIFDLKRDELHPLLTDLINLENVEMENYDVAAASLEAFHKGMDLADALHLTTANSSGLPFYTFDKALVKHSRKAQADAFLLKS
jgi:predicted nucleic-acid-binding protein